MRNTHVIILLLLPFLSFGGDWPWAYYPANASCSPTLDYFEDVSQTPNTYLKFNLEYTNFTGPQLIDGYDLQYPNDPWGANGWEIIISRKDVNGDPSAQEFVTIYTNTPYQHYNYEFQYPFTNTFTGATFDYYKYYYKTESIDIKSLFPDHVSSDDYIVTLAKVSPNPIAWPPLSYACINLDLPSLGVYQGIDSDGDGIFDFEDNCINASNADQNDIDDDDIGDVCDNCPNDSNENQEDNDNDGLGDVCDDDDDNDGIIDINDNCPLVANPDQADSNNDGLGNACSDEDEDGFIDINDNCPQTANANQVDADGDGVGDICDNCEDTLNANQADSDGDGLGDVCDNCPNNSNSSQSDNDSDGIGNACDDDLDGDGIVNNSDDCPYEAGPASNNGCPLPSGEPDLRFINNSVYISSECFNCQGNLSNQSSSDIHLLSKNAGILTITGLIENIGEVSAGSSNIKAYFSTNSELDNNDIELVIGANGSSNESAVNSISPNNAQAFSASIFGSNIGSNVNFDTYYLIVKVDGGNTITEKNEDNNTFHFLLRYRLNFSSKFPKKIINLERLSSIIVNNKQEEDLALQNLKGVIYIIVENDGRKTKVLKLDNIR